MSISRRKIRSHLSYHFSVSLEEPSLSIYISKLCKIYLESNPASSDINLNDQLENIRFVCSFSSENEIHWKILLEVLTECKCRFNREGPILKTLNKEPVSIPVLKILMHRY